MLRAVSVFWIRFGLQPFPDLKFCRIKVGHIRPFAKQTVMDKVRCVQQEHELAVKIGLKRALHGLVQIIDIFEVNPVFQVRVRSSHFCFSHTGVAAQSTYLRDWHETGLTSVNRGR